MSIKISPDPTDHAAFVSMIERTIARLDQDNDPAEVFIIEIKNWFDHKWLKFSGIGRVSFHSSRDSHPQVALAEFYQKKITFPPFTPNRVLREQCWAYDTSKRRNLVHRKLRQNSARNLQRRVTQFTTSALFVWFSSGTSANDRGSLMVYQATAENVSA